jgi:hypothetical protein
MATYSYDEIYAIYAWRDNNKRLLVTQGEGVNDVAEARTCVKSVRFQLKDERGVIAIPSTGASVQLAITRADNTEILIASDAISDTDKTNGIISFPITTALTAVSGKAHGEIRLITPNAIIKFYGINFVIYNGVSNQAAIQSEEFDDLIKSLQRVNTLIDEIRKIYTYSYTIPVSNWNNNTQILNLSNHYNVTNKTKIDIEGNDSVIEQLITDGCDGIYITNNNGVLTLHAINNPPSVNITVQLIIYEVENLS